MPDKCVWIEEKYENANGVDHCFIIKSEIDGYRQCRRHTIPSLELKSWVIVNFKYCPYCGKEIEEKHGDDE